MPLISVIIPARDEEENIAVTIKGICVEFKKHDFEYEIIVISDGSTDATEQVVAAMAASDAGVKIVRNTKPYGFGNAIKKGLDVFNGDYVIIAMADSSDSPEDMARYVNEMKDNGYDCCFGSRWGCEAVVAGYPKIKMALNRAANGFIQILFGLKYNDVTNAFKSYSRQTIAGIKPILSHHFNITVELPLKAIVRGYKYKVIATDWHERRRGKTSLKIQEMGSRYLFIILYVFLEKLLCSKDYHK